MNETRTNSRLIRFSIFELDRDSGELFKQGRKVKLQGQPFELLVALLDRPGEVLTREELRQKIWPSEIAGDFDQGLNRAINKVREALGDSAETPHFIETVPRRGYRFIGAIEEHAAVPKTLTEMAKPKSPSRRWAPLAIAAASALAVATVWLLTHRTTEKGPIRVQQLTTNSTDNPVWQAAISPDGKYLAYGDSDGIKIRVIATGETHLLPKPAELSDREIWLPAAWFPDGTRLLASSIGRRMSAWSVSVIGGKATLLRDDAGVDSVSPDGSLIAFTTGNTYRAQPPDNNATSLLNTEIWVMGPNGENARKIVSAQKGTYFASVRWSPTGERLAYRKLRLAHEDSEYSIETCDPNGGTPTVVLSSRRLRWYSAGSDLGSGDLAWTPDGRLNYALNEAAPNLTDRNLWATPVNPKTGKVRGNPQRVTNLTGLSMNGLSVTTDGKRMVFDSESDGSQIYIRSTVPNADLRSAKLLTHDKRYNEPFTWTADSKAVIFASNRAGAFGIYKQALDQSEAEFIPTGEGENILVRRSPDGKWIISTRARGQGQSREFIRIPVIGGAPQPLFKTNGGYDNFSCPYRADARCIVSECVDYKRCVFESFDVVTRSRSKLFDMPMPEQREFHWTVSPDGSHLAMIGPDPQGRIEIRSLRGEIERTIEAKGWPNPLQIDWTADSKSVIVRCLGLIDSPSGPLGGTLLRVDFDGNVEPLWETRGGRTTWAIPSPDGKYLAIRDPVSDRNVWMIENF